MKTADEIRTYRDAILTYASIPCGCKASGHGPECDAGRRIMTGVAATLSWVLGESSGMEPLVEMTIARANRERARDLAHRKERRPVRNKARRPKGG
jgi:hypothetical protein